MKFTVVVLTFIAAGWVFFDARERGKGMIVAFLWCLGTQLLPIIVLPLWLIKRPERMQRVIIVGR